MSRHNELRRLNHSCPDCTHAAWLHTGMGCVAQRPSDASQMRFTACGCVRGLGSF